MPIISVKRAKQPSTETPRLQIGQTATTVTDVDIGSDQDTIPALGGDLDKNPRDQTTSNPGDQTHATSLPGPSKKKRDQQQRRPGWYHTAVRATARTKPHPRRLGKADGRELRSLRWGV